MWLSLPYFLTAFALGVILLYFGQSGNRWGRWLLAGMVGVCWLLSVPMGADLVSHLIGGSYRPLISIADARAASTVVVLDGGAYRYRSRSLRLDFPNTPAALRALEAVRVYRLLGSPMVVVTAGDKYSRDPKSPEGGPLRDAIVQSGVPADRVILDSESPNTRAHATTLARMLQPCGVSRIVLVTSLTHIRRAVWAFRAVGFEVIASPAPAHSETSVWRWTNWWPIPEALRVSEDSLRDVLAIAYYWAKGWFRPDQY